MTDEGGLASTAGTTVTSSRDPGGTLLNTVEGGRSTTGHQHALDTQLCHGVPPAIPRPATRHRVGEPDRPVRGLPGQLGGPGDAAHITCAPFRAARTRGAVSPSVARRNVERRAAMSKRGRKRRSRKKNGANHGKRPNA